MFPGRARTFIARPHDRHFRYGATDGRSHFGAPNAKTPFSRLERRSKTLILAIAYTPTSPRAGGHSEGISLDKGSALAFSV